ncbi:MAG: protoporphyrinogen oxidase [Acidimicrobiia bacterium]
MRVVVVGAGLAGLFTACELIAQGIDDVVVVDDSPEPGGITRTIVRDGYTLEPGAGSFVLPHPDLNPLLDQVGARLVSTRPTSSVRYVYTDDRLVAIPASPGALLAPVIPIAAKVRALLEPMIRSKSPKDESLDSFCRRRFGSSAGEMLASLMAAGVFAGDPRRISVEAAFPTLSKLEDHGSVLLGAMRKRRARTGPRPSAYIPVGGMAGLAESAASFLGDRLRSNFRVDSVHEEDVGWVVLGPEALAADAVVIAADPTQAAAMLDGDLSVLLARAEGAPVVVVGLGGSDDDAQIPDGFGALVHSGDSMIIRGILFESSYALGRVPEGSWLLKVIAGGATAPGVVDWEKGRLVERLVSEGSRIVGAELDPTFVEVVRHRRGIPQYGIGHMRWLDEIDALVAARPGLALTGWGYRGVGVAKIASDARAVASKLACDAR